MNAQATKLQAAENNLKQLMADVARAVEKAQQAVGRITSKAAATTTETESMIALERVLRIRGEPNEAGRRRADGTDHARRAGSIQGQSE